MIELSNYRSRGLRIDDVTLPFITISRAHSLHRKWSCISRTLGDNMFGARCFVLNSYLIDRYFSVHLTTNIGDVKLSTNVVYGRNGLCTFIIFKRKNVILCAIFLLRLSHPFRPRTPNLFRRSHFSSIPSCSLYLSAPVYSILFHPSFYLYLSAPVYSILFHPSFYLYLSAPVYFILFHPSFYLYLSAPVYSILFHPSFSLYLSAPVFPILFQPSFYLYLSAPVYFILFHPSFHLYLSAAVYSILFHPSFPRISQHKLYSVLFHPSFSP